LEEGRRVEEGEVVYMKIRHAKASIVIEQVLENVPVFQDKNSKAFVKCRFFWLPWRRSRRSFNYDGTLAASTQIIILVEKLKLSTIFFLRRTTISNFFEHEIFQN
jgi:hypothetical protein